MGCLLWIFFALIVGFLAGAGWGFIRGASVTINIHRSEET